MIVKNLTSPEPLCQFVRNAREYGHSIHSVVIAYSHEVSPSAVNALAAETDVFVTRLNQPELLQREFRKRNLSHFAAEELLHCPALESHGLVPYGFNRNTVLMAAALTGTDTLIFVDSDVKPEVLRRDSDGSIRLQAVDFTGRHLQALSQGADISTSEYSGYRILPPARIQDMESLLIGLQKEDMLSYWQSSTEHQCLAVSENAEPAVGPTQKVLGGNLGMKLSSLSKLPPFFSPTYLVSDTLFLARGEDTLIGLEARRRGLQCMDIDTLIFHDTFGQFPKAPDLESDREIQLRLFYACTGWLGRNPFMNWLSGLDVEKERAARERQLERGASALSRYTQNPIFLDLPRNFRAAYDSLPEMKRQYSRTMEAWNEFVERSGLS
jgi:hypothetical protein